MPKFVIPVSWQMCGEFEVIADSLEEAIKTVESDDAQFCIGNVEDSEYVDGSFVVDVVLAEQMNEEIVTSIDDFVCEKLDKEG